MNAPDPAYCELCGAEAADLALITLLWGERAACSDCRIAIALDRAVRARPRP